MKDITHSDKCISDHGEGKRVPEKKCISALLTMPKPLTVWITKNCGNATEVGPEAKKVKRTIERGNERKRR